MKREPNEIAPARTLNISLPICKNRAIFFPIPLAKTRLTSKLDKLFKGGGKKNLTMRIFLVHKMIRHLQQKKKF